MGFGLAVIAVLLWVWCGVLLAMPYEVGPGFSGSTRKCEARLFTDEGTANVGRIQAPCADERDWPKVLAVLGLSVPVSVAACALITYGSLSIRMSKHAAALAGLRESDAREEKEKEEEKDGEKEKGRDGE
ncbi:hypothetical protein [Streptomyces bugieae]|uniref:Uncharacterized protein n=1 Tax=Streptomyces bugieae TaxID=3098223 RepID=A0ABU7NGL0_9ACTN|nr:hypothetical protein [Streptomyces sp. DSM 41528]